MICAFYFDKENNFSGIKTYDINSQMYETHTAAIPIDYMKQALPDDQMMMAEYELARLVGLRTQKGNEGSYNVMSVQPIYVSKDKGIFNEQL